MNASLLNLVWEVERQKILFVRTSKMIKINILYRLGVEGH